MGGGAQQHAIVSPVVVTHVHLKLYYIPICVNFHLQHATIHLPIHKVKGQCSSIGDHPWPDLGEVEEWTHCLGELKWGGVGAGVGPGGDGDRKWGHPLKLCEACLSIDGVHYVSYLNFRGQTHDQEAAVQRTFHLERSSFVMERPCCSVSLLVFCTLLHWTQSWLLLFEVKPCTMKTIIVTTSQNV